MSPSGVSHTPLRLTRRGFLIGAGVTGTAIALSGCTQNQPTPTAAPAVTSPTSAGSSAKPAVAATPAAASPVAATPAATGATPAATPPAAAFVKPLTSQRQIDKPIPEQFFIPQGTNAETRFEQLNRQGLRTPNGVFFVRSHAASVLIDPKAYRLRVQGSGVQRQTEFTYDEILKMPSKTVTRFVECSGNGRSFYQTMMNRPAQGTQWKLGGIGIAEWTGVPLSEVINRAGLKQSATEVMCIGLDEPQVRRPIPIAKAMEEDSMLVYLMNGDILPIDHGFPVRSLVSGWGGINSLKWVGTVAVTEEHNRVQWNTDSYVLIGPDYPPPAGEKGPPANEQVLKSAVALPWQASLKAGRQKIEGLAWSPEAKIAKVEVSTDGGKSWAPARLVEPNVAKAGVRWEFDLDARAGEMTITPRATDEAGKTQWALDQQKWNQLGYFFGAVVPHPVTVA